MSKYEYLNKINLQNKTYDGFTLNEIIENIGYYHMTKHLKGHKNPSKNDTKYLKIVQIYSENPQIRRKIIEKLLKKDENKSKNS